MVFSSMVRGLGFYISCALAAFALVSILLSNSQPQHRGGTQHVTATEYSKEFHDTAMNGIRKKMDSMTIFQRKDALYKQNDRRAPGRKRILVTGGAGFVGSHLVDKLMNAGHDVVVIDNYFTGRRQNVEHWLGHPRFELVRHDVVQPFFVEVDQIYHLACPASPPHYQYNPIKTIKTSTAGTINMLGLAHRVKARLLMASTSEVYGDPKVHPQVETYWGNVNPIGPRACYDEGKRVAESLCYAYNKQENVEVRVARIFNTYGPRMHPNDGRVVSNFIIQALTKSPITIYGDGEHTRSFQYVEDLVDGLIALMNSDYDQPVNLGNPDEYSIKHFAETIVEIVGNKVPITHLAAPVDDPQRRKPDIGVARRELGWAPKWSVRDGLEKTIAYFKKEIATTDAGKEL